MQRLDNGLSLYIFQGHEDVGAEDLVCAVRFSDDPNKKMDYIVSELVTAMLRGGMAAVRIMLTEQQVREGVERMAAYVTESYGPRPLTIIGRPVSPGPVMK